MSNRISHFENLPIEEIINFLQNINEFEITEKVDGANIAFGLDEKGLYTTFEHRGMPGRYYHESEYEKRFATTYQRLANMALKKIEPYLITCGLEQGDLVECEVLYDKIPNVIEYHTHVNEIILLRTLKGSFDVNNVKSVTIELDPILIPCTSDGKEILVEKTKSLNFTFRVLTIENNCGFDAKPLLEKLNKFLSQKNEYGSTAEEVLKWTKNKKPEVLDNDWKNIVDKERTRVRAEKDVVISEIKEDLLNSFVRKKLSRFGSNWIEGIVFRKDDYQVKLIDKNVFSKIKEFVWRERNEVAERSNRKENASILQKALNSDRTDATISNFEKILDYKLKRYLRKRKKYFISVPELSQKFFYNSSIHTRTLQVYAETRKKIQSLKN